MALETSILIIDNDRGTVAAISQALKSRGYSVFGASTADMGIIMAKKTNPSLIFLNLATPGTNGLNICNRIQNIESLKDVPIILLTTKQVKIEPSHKTSYGIVGFLQKPLTDEELLSTAENILTPDAVTLDLQFAGLEPEQPEQKEEQPVEHTGETPELTETDEPFEKDIPEHAEIKDPFEETTPEHTETEELPETEEQEQEEDEEFADALNKETPPAEIHGAGQKKKSGKILLPVMAIAVVAIVAVLSYIFFFKPAEELPPWEIPEKPTPELESKVVPEEKIPEAVKPEDTKPEKPVESVKPVPPKPAETYHVQFGAFGTEKNAKHFVEELKYIGFKNAFVHKGTSNGRPIYRVLTGEFESKAAASRLARQIRDKEGFETTVFSRKGS